MSKILLIEDDTILVSMYRDKFHNEGFEVEVAGNGEEGVNKMRSFRPDLVILDLIMPERNGFDVLREAREDAELKKIPVVVLTNVHLDTDDLVTNWGVKEIILKANSTPEQVVVKIKELVTSLQPQNPT